MTKEKIILFILQGYTQAEIGLFLGISQQHVGRLMRKIPVLDPYIVGRKMEEVQKIEAELKIYHFQEKKMRHPRPDINPDPRGWVLISEGGYLRRKFPTSEEQFERG